MRNDLIHIDEVSSTNSLLKDLYYGGLTDEGTTVTADFQTAGRGQKGNSWEAEKGMNLLFSTLIYPSFLQIKQQFIISQIASLAVKNTLDKYVGNIAVKWSNDIYYKDYKICGMLIENNLNENRIASSVIGIGMNINQTEFIHNRAKAISLKQITGKDYDKRIILSEFLENFNKLYEWSRKEKTPIIQQYKENLYRKNGYFRYADKNGEFIARIEDITEEGLLILETGKGEKRSYAFKEVQFL